MDWDIDYKWFGLKSYSEGLSLQNEQREKVKASSKVFLVGLEHSEVITLGIRSHKDKDLLSLSSQYEVVKAQRGGHATVHNPGQLIIYPIVPLRFLELGVRDFVCLLIKTTKEFFKDYGIETFEKEEPGLFTEKGKIALFGIQVKHGVSQHGLSINISNDLQSFKNIPVCNVKNEPMDKLSNYADNLPLEELFEKWVRIFKKNLVTCVMHKISNA